MPGPDLTPLSDEQRKMVESVIPMIHHFRRKAGLVMSENQYDEFLSYGYEKICQAARAFDPARGSWPTFAASCILRHQREWFSLVRLGVNRRELRTMRDVARGVGSEGAERVAHVVKTKQSLDYRAPDGANPFEYLRSDSNTPEDEAMIKALKQIVDHVLALRPDRHRHVFLSHIEGETLSEIAQRLGISRERARQINQDVKDRILKELQEEDERVQ